jgi:hypothetical protein
MYLKGNLIIKASLIFILSAAFISGCGGNLFTYKGDRVTREDLISKLEDGNQKGVWKTNELAITYQYQKTPETLKISGSVELVGGFAIGFRQIERLAVFLLFLDNQGTVIENSLIYAVGNHHSIDMIPMLFEKTIPVPDGTKTISFAYDGLLMDSGDDGSTGYSIGFSPSVQWIK